MNNDYENCIPQLDLSEWIYGDEESKTKFAKKWNQAFCTSGFCTIFNHGVPLSIINDLYHSAHTFFDLPQEEKSQYKSKDFLGPGFHQRGGESYESIDKKTKPDQNEFYYISSISEDVKVDLPTEDERPPVLRQPCSQYWLHLKKLTSILHDISDRALGLPPGTFAHFHTLDKGEFGSSLRITNYYPLSPEDISAGVKRIGSHTDYMGFTILKCDEVPGLEVAFGQQDYDLENIAPKTFEKWVPVKPVKDGFIINAGDFLRYWTNGYWTSAFHRVVAVPDRRLSIIFFTGPPLSARTDVRFPSSVCSGPDKFPTVKMNLSQYFDWRKLKGEVKN